MGSWPKIFKKPLSLSLAILTLLASTSFSIDQHECRISGKKKIFVNQTESCCANELSKEAESTFQLPGCCDISTFSFEAGVFSFQKQLELKIFSAFTRNYPVPDFGAVVNLNQTVHGYSPPITDSGIPKQVILQVFRI